MNAPVRPACSARFYEAEPSWKEDDGTRHWVVRGANFVVVASHAAPDAVMTRSASSQQDEYMVLLPEGTSATLRGAGGSQESGGDSLFIVPPGESELHAGAGGWLYRVFSSRAGDLANRASNAQDYERGAPDVSPLEDWPEPAGGYRLRHYALADHARADTTMRLFRSRNLMINIFLRGKAPRDVGKMTPHSHADFEQGSLALCGSYVHHLRYPWTPDLRAWREDEHGLIGAPSLIVIPPKVIHTSQSVGEPPMQLVDIFSPPRDDFSLKPGLVCNAVEYPLPERLKAAAPAHELA